MDTPTDSTRQKIEFILETEKLKAVLRKNKPLGLNRYENTAEHSWQTALTALLFIENAPQELDTLKILKMMIVHDLVEIDAGDVMVYDETARLETAAVEQAAAERIFGMLPDPLGSELHELWLEFEEANTPEAKYAKAIDRVNPVLQNLFNNGQSWVENNISLAQVLNKNTIIENASPPLWKHLKRLIEKSPFLN